MARLCATSSATQVRAAESAQGAWFPRPGDRARLATVEPLNPHQPSPSDLARQAEERRIADAVRLRRWRQRRISYGLLTVGAGIVVPSISLIMAGSISAEGFWNWIAHSGWLPLVITSVGGASAALVVFLRGWGVSLGMICFGVLFAVLVVVSRAVLGALLPAMPGLVALFVIAGALVGYLTTLEEGE